MQEKTVLTLNHDKDFCSQFSFTIQDRPYANKIASLPIELSSKLLEDEAALTPYSERNITRVIAFDKHCGPDDRCQSKLSIEGSSNLPSILYGPETTVDLDVVVKNSGENSYGTYLYVLNEDFKNYRFQTRIMVTKKKKVVLNCDEPDDGVSRCPIGNPLGEESVKIKLRYRIWPAWTKVRRLSKISFIKILVKNAVKRIAQLLHSSLITRTMKRKSQIVLFLQFRTGSASNSSTMLKSTPTLSLMMIRLILASFPGRIEFKTMDHLQLTDKSALISRRSQLEVVNY